MQDVENNMDNLFRKAVDNYTLHSGESNWEAIVAQLSDDDSAANNTEINHKNNVAFNGILLLLLLLVPLGTAMFSSYYTGNSSAKLHKAALSHISTPQKLKNSSTTAISKQNIKMYTADTFQNFSASKAKIYIAETHKNIQVVTPADRIRNAENESEKKVDTSYSVSNIIPAPDTSAPMNSNQSKNANNKKPWRKHRMYAGIVGGLAFNEVKHQGFKKPGFDLGVVAGYTINKKTAVEISLVYSKKYYFSDGKYFSMDKMSGSMPAEMKVLSLEGNSNLYQIPVAIKYDIAHKKASTVFSSAGISSYILTKEKNDYQISMNGEQQKMKGMYKNVSAGLASSIDISIGYEHTIQRAATLRVQPYLQIPLKGMGMGSMQVMSTGIHIAYIR